MDRAILVLQYPDPRRQRTVALAATRNPTVMRAFKEAVLGDAKLAVLDREDDDLLLLQDRLELRRLQQLLDRVVPARGRDESN